MLADMLHVEEVIRSGEAFFVNQLLWYAPGVYVAGLGLEAKTRPSIKPERYQIQLRLQPLEFLNFKQRMAEASYGVLVKPHREIG